MLDASPAPSFDLDAFRDWLTANGAEVQKRHAPDEILRAETSCGGLIVNKIKHGVPVGPAPVIDRLVSLFIEGCSPDLRPASDYHGMGTAAMWRKRAHDALSRRDGPGCWYCGCGGAMTIEHLLALAFGGSNHRANLVLSCWDCNREADCLSVAEKVRLREAKRAEGYA
jgi:hypothetical protein